MMNEQTQIELLKLAAQMTEAVIQDKTGAKNGVIAEAKKGLDPKTPDYRAVFDYWFAYLKQSIK